ncbi:hypothetical protein DF044_38415 [Burkholderia contaminans]|uniref:hypothetical protein n=1 Tax=Burkholderia contaminans TaxID=488447 RepID=UPI000F59C404|nr:hypothetical protein [Burkholderia contaminans]RQT01759.1 hypothetical protein DF044_38415 [Burkholderia contaminans]
MTELTSVALLADVRRMINAARASAAGAVDAALTLLDWQVRRPLREDMLRGECAGNGQQIVPALALRLTAPEWLMARWPFVPLKRRCRRLQGVYRCGVDQISLRQRYAVVAYSVMRGLGAIQH